eukprot:CAMPEP_0202361902 /NCGR_PEP_ID=MMETSP1126-20121109/14282_1 /ASSEMBLY_ACC=CAM_ASM_000457 /TAXON_ID=3047 /ORGANISM="Dunaliella tertiolecta, Strain CCMP1320" /LENGTH=67 /DNA_ID=CAMNT_0048955953 /DNA_START=96 /DNA_END=296 /DNA_ORIENTATION=-
MSARGVAGRGQLVQLEHGPHDGGGSVWGGDGGELQGCSHEVLHENWRSRQHGQAIMLIPMLLLLLLL